MSVSWPSSSLLGDRCGELDGDLDRRTEGEQEDERARFIESNTLRYPSIRQLLSVS